MVYVLIGSLQTKVGASRFVLPSVCLSPQHSISLWNPSLLSPTLQMIRTVDDCHGFLMSK